jgi:hypothetical protein
MECFQNAQVSLATAVSYMCKMFMKLIPLVMLICFSPSKISWEIHFRHYPMEYSQNAQASFAMGVSNECKMFKKFIPVVEFMLIPYSPIKISWEIHYRHYPNLCFQNPPSFSSYSCTLHV